MAFSYGLKTDRRAGSQHYITSIHNGDWLKVRSVDFGEKGATNFSACVAGLMQGGSIELRIDALGGSVIGTLDVSPTGGSEQWKVQTTQVNAVKGVHDLYLLFKGGDKELFNVDYWTFNH